jgi:hypothetical protein
MLLRLSARDERLELDLVARSAGASRWSRLAARLASLAFWRRRADADSPAAASRRLSFLLRAEAATLDLDYLQLRDAEWELRLQAMDDRRVHVTLQSLAPETRLWFAGAIERLR